MVLAKSFPVAPHHEQEKRRHRAKDEYGRDRLKAAAIPASLKTVDDDADRKERAENRGHNAEADRLASVSVVSNLKTWVAHRHVNPRRREEIRDRGQTFLEPHR